MLTFLQNKRKLWRARRIRRLVEGGRITLNEARAKIGLPRVEDPLFEEKKRRA